MPTETETETPVSTTPPTPESKAPDVTAAEKLIAKHDSAAAAVLALMGENYRARDDKRQAEAKVPPAGSVVLTADEAKAWDAYRTLGKPEDVRKIKAEHGEYATKLTGLERESEVRGFMEAANMDAKQAPQFMRLLGDAAPVRTVAKDPKTGKDVETLAAKVGDAEPVPLADLIGAKQLAALYPDAKVDPSIPPRRQAAPLPPVIPTTNATRPRVML